MRLVASLLCASQEEEEKPDEKQTACEENQCCQTWTGRCPVKLLLPIILRIEL